MKPPQADLRFPSSWNPEACSGFGPSLDSLSAPPKRHLSSPSTFADFYESVRFPIISRFQQWCSPQPPIGPLLLDLFVLCGGSTRRSLWGGPASWDPAGPLSQGAFTHCSASVCTDFRASVWHRPVRRAESEPSLPGLQVPVGELERCHEPCDSASSCMCARRSTLLMELEGPCSELFPWDSPSAAPSSLLPAPPCRLCMQEAWRAASLVWTLLMRKEN